MPWFQRHPTGRPPHPDVLTPAEWRVLEHVREGRSNSEIAETLGVSLNTVKTQISSMLGKLELRDRSELAAWDGAPAEATRVALGRMQLAVPFGWLGRAAAGAGVVTLGVVFLLAMQWMNDASPSGGGPEGTPTSAPIASVTSAPDEVPAPLLMPFRGVEPTGRPVSIPDEEVVVGSPPAPAFGPRDSESREVVLYDIDALSERALGEGGYPRFSPGGTWLGWIAFTNPPSVMAGELHVVELATGEERMVGTARSLRWLDNDRVIVHVRGNEMAIIDVRTGDYGDPGSLNLNPDPFREEAAGVRLDDITPEITGAPSWRQQYRLTYLDGSSPPVEFEAYRARLAPVGMVVMGIAPLDAEIDVQWGTPVPGDIYLADPWSMEATYVGTGLLSYGMWPLDVSAEFVFWTDDACALGDAGGSRFFYRETGRLVAVDERFLGEFTPSGEVAMGPFGAERIFDPRSMTYDLVLLEGPVIAKWSPDYRFAAIGYEAGRGGVCG